MIDANDPAALIILGNLEPIPDTNGYINGVYGQNIYDICGMSYGSFDYLYKLVLDNGLENLNALDATGINFVFDKTLVQNAAIFTQNFKYNIVYATFNPPPDNFFIIDLELRDDFTEELRDDSTDELE